MAHLIDKDALVAEIKERIETYNKGYANGDDRRADALEVLLHDINTLEVKEVGISIPNIDDLFEEEGIDPNSKEAKVFKECYYMALEKLKEEKGEEI